jgi:hypothetical protein
MPLPLPVNCKFDEEKRGVFFTVTIDGKEWKCFITKEAIESLYPTKDLVRAVSESSEVTRGIAMRLKCGDVVEPIYLVSTMLDKKGLWIDYGH